VKALFAYAKKWLFCYARLLLASFFVTSGLTYAVVRYPDLTGIIVSTVGLTVALQEVAYLAAQYVRTPPEEAPREGQN
jgi:hypothetical protein